MPLLKVIRASAGSGKTFSLTQEYLRLLFTGHEAFMHILAVTFTNKATEEMKTRIINELFALASGKQSKQLIGLLKSTGFSEIQLRNKSSVIIKRLLHNYSRFSVNTIDSFFQRIIRSFTRELGIQEGYSIELDTELVLTEVIDKLLLQAEKDKALLSWLIRFAESLIEKGESWNLRKGVRDLGEEIFKEEFKSLDEGSLKKFYDRNYLTDYNNELLTYRIKTEDTYRSFGLKAIEILKNHGLIVDDFNRKQSGAAGFLVKLASGAFKAPTDTALSAANNADKWYTAGSPRKTEISVIALKFLMPLLKEVIDFYNQSHRNYYSVVTILKHLYTLGILMDLSQITDKWCAENNTFILPWAPGFINKIIDGNDTPFIYEKAGYWFHHFMIDEFQDTSFMQWQNFKPLISNSLSQDFDNLVVGDTKQSIYRWRNSSWEILENHIHSDFLPGVAKTITLKENWRSGTEIIHFNNHFFSKAAGILQEDFIAKHASKDIKDQENIKSIADLYVDMEQTPGNPDNNGGFVQIEYLRDEEDLVFCDDVNTRVIKLLDELLDKGYQLNDIAILTRKNKEAKSIAEFLLGYAGENSKRRIDVISDDALRLGSSAVVNFVISLLQYIHDPGEKTNTYTLQSVLANYISLSAETEEWTSQEGPFKLPKEFIELTRSSISFSLVEILERIIKTFHLERHTGEQVYLWALRDTVIEYTNNYGSNIPRFLLFWFETGKERSVPAPSGQDAVRIITLHKAKGLEFKITILPYCTWELISYNNIIWCKPSEAPFDKVPVIPLSFTTKLQNTVFSQDYMLESYRQLVDNLNLLYVAFTRAREGLFVYCKASEKGHLKTVSDLVTLVLSNSTFRAGSLPEKETKHILREKEIIPFNPVGSNELSQRIKIAFQGKVFVDPSVNKPSRPLNDGKILHEIFNLIHSRDDVSFAIDKLHLQGKIAFEEQNRFLLLILDAMNDIQVSTWFTNNWTVINEAEIILPGGKVKRPDRVMTKENQTLLIDYKFGVVPNRSHENQIREYASLLSDMGYQNIEAYLWYVRIKRVQSIILS